MAYVTRNHPKLTLEGACAVLSAAQRRAEEIRCPMDIAVVDEGAHLLAFERMDGETFLHRHRHGQGASCRSSPLTHRAGDDRR